MIKPDKVAEALVESAHLEGDENSVAEKFFNLAKENHFTHQAPEIMRYLKIFSDKSKNIDTVKIVVSHEVSPSVLGEIEKVMGANGVKREVVVDKNIIGGFLAEFQGKILDATIKSQLMRLGSKISGVNS